jgi:cell division protein FtsN
MSNSEYEIERGVYQTPSNDDDLYDEYDDEEGFGRGPVFAIFAVIVLAAFVGIVWLAYQQGVRQGQLASPPIITASDDPFKVEPTDPEGMAQPQDTLTDEVLAGEPLEQQPTTVTSSTERPIESVRVADEPALDSTPSLRTSDVDIPAAEESSASLTVPPPSTRVREADVQAAEAVTAATTEANESPPAEVVTTEEPEIVVSQPLIQPEPEPQVTVSEPIPQPQTPSASSFDVNGTFVVQVASVPERSDANGVWSRLVSRHGAIIQGYAQDIQTVDLGERGTWYRVRIGFFGSSADANEVCDQLKNAGQDCLVASR